jgi:hypothetical protein
MLPMPSGAVVGFLDTEGFSASDRTADYDAKIFAISALLSTHLLYNSVRIIDTASIECVRRPSPHTLTSSHPSNPLSVPAPSFLPRPRRACPPPPQRRYRVRRRQRIRSRSDDAAVGDPLLFFTRTLPHRPGNLSNMAAPRELC